MILMKRVFCFINKKAGRFVKSNDIDLPQRGNGGKIVLAVLLFAGMFSCKKTEITSLKVVVYNPATNVRLANFHLSLTETVKKFSFNIGGSGYSYFPSVIKEGYTDANGECDFGEIETRKSDKYDYTVTYHSGSGVKKLEKGVQNNISIIAAYPATVYVNFLPPPPYNIGDSLVVNFVHDYYIKYKITNINYFSFHQLRLNNLGTYFINIDKYKSGIYTNSKDTVVYLDGTTNNYDINW